MVRQVKTLKFIIVFALLAILVFLALTLRGNVETNLLKTILPSDIAASTDIIPIANKSASVIKVVFEADSVQNLDKLRDDFIASVDKNYFEINKPDVSNLLNQYLSHPANFLSDSARELLKNEKYDEVYARSLQALYNPTGIQLSAIDKDPYLFVDDFILANSKFYRTVSSSDDKYYDFLSVKIKSKEGLSPDLSNKKIAEIVKLQKNLTNSSSKIYLAGSPVHSYTTSTNSVVSINIICFLSTLLIAVMTYYYFRSIKVLIPIALSIIFGMLAGYVATKLWFDNFQIITMVFSTISSGSVQSLSGLALSIRWAVHISSCVVQTRMPACPLFCLMAGIRSSPSPSSSPMSWLMLVISATTGLFPGSDTAYVSERGYSSFRRTFRIDRVRNSYSRVSVVWVLPVDSFCSSMRWMARSKTHCAVVDMMLPPTSQSRCTARGEPRRAPLWRRRYRPLPAPACKRQISSPSISHARSGDCGW